MAMAHGLSAEQVQDILNNPQASPHAGEKTKALLAFAAQITKDPTKIWQQDADDLRALGFSDSAILEAIFVASLFNAMDRLADATGTPSENMRDSMG